MSTPSEAPLTLVNPDDLAVTVLAVRGREALSEPFAFDVDWRVPGDGAMPFEDLLGTKLRCRCVSPTRRRASSVASSNRSSRPAATMGTSIIGSRWCRVLASSRTAPLPRLPGLSVPEILRALLAGLDVSYEIGGSPRPRNYCVQYRETDFAFASRLMEEEGIYYFFRHRRDGHAMVVTDALTHPALPDTSAIEFDPGGKEAQGRIRRWECFQEITSSRFAVWDHHFELPSQPVEGAAVVPETVAAGPATLRLRGAFNDALDVRDGPASVAHHFDAVGPNGRDRPDDLPPLFDAIREPARYRAETAAAEALDIGGDSNCPAFTPGSAFALTRHPDAEGDYYLTQVEHAATQPPPRSGGSAQLRYENRFRCLPAGLAYRPARRTPRPRIAGLETAVVVGPPGQAVHLDRHGRVRVRFRWAHGAEAESCWVRVAQVWAGKGWARLLLGRASGMRSSSLSKRAIPIARSSSAASTTQRMCRPSRCRPTRARVRHQIVHGQRRCPARPRLQQPAHVRRPRSRACPGPLAARGNHHRGDRPTCSRRPGVATGDGRPRARRRQWRLRRSADAARR